MLNDLAMKKMSAYKTAIAMVIILSSLNINTLYANENNTSNREYVVGALIFENERVAKIVGEAQKYDPIQCSNEYADRNKAIALYEQAISIQPNARVNAALANRIGQMYAFMEDKKKGIYPEPIKAKQAWLKCLQWTNPKQLLWAEAQMGYASASVMMKDAESAISAYKKILSIDPATIELPDWKVFRGIRGSDELLRYDLKNANAIRIQAIEMIAYVAKKANKKVEIAELKEISIKYKGTEVGTRASELLMEVLGVDADFVASFIDMQLKDLMDTSQDNKMEDQSIAKTKEVGQTLKEERKVDVIKKDKQEVAYITLNGVLSNKIFAGLVVLILIGIAIMKVYKSNDKSRLE